MDVKAHFSTSLLELPGFWRSLPRALRVRAGAEPGPSRPPADARLVPGRPSRGAPTRCRLSSFSSLLHLRALGEDSLKIAANLLRIRLRKNGCERNVETGVQRSGGEAGADASAAARGAAAGPVARDDAASGSRGCRSRRCV